MWIALAQNAVLTFLNCLSNQQLAVMCIVQIAIVLSAKTAQRVALAPLVRCFRLTLLVVTAELKLLSYLSCQVETNLYTAKTALWHVAVNTNWKLNESNPVKRVAFFVFLWKNVNQVFMSN
jgi:hypothetical protein